MAFDTSGDNEMNNSTDVIKVGVNKNKNINEALGKIKTVSR